MKSEMTNESPRVEDYEVLIAFAAHQDEGTAG
jgi:hypothetical protein